MKKTHRSSILLLTLSAFILILFSTIGITQAATPDRQVETAWDLATQLGDFSYQTRLEQTTQPLPSLANAGLGNTTEYLYIEGQNNLSDDEMSMRIWVDGQSPLNEERALEISIRDGRTFGRIGDSEWEEMDDISDLIAPGRDNLGFLAAAKNVSPAEAQNRSGIAFDRYTFDMDGPAFAQYMREQMEAELARKGALPPGVTMEASGQYAEMTGAGEFWVDERGLPLRLITNMTLPPADGEQVSVEVVTDFADWDESLAAKAVTWQGQAQLAAPTVIRQGSLGIAAVTGFLGLFFATIAALQKIGWQRTYRGIAAALVVILVLQPLLQPVTVQAAYERFNEFQAQQQRFHAASQRAAEEDAAAQNFQNNQFNARQNPLANVNHNSERDSLSVPAAVNLDPLSPDDVDTDGDLLPDDLELLALCTDPNDPDTDNDGIDDGVEILSDGFLTDPCSADTDGDGLTDIVELLDLGTDPEDIDTDGDFISDKTEVQGFTGPDGQLRYLDATSYDTNADGREDGFECLALVDVEYDDTLQISVFIDGANPTTSTTCSNVDGDEEPDVLDRDDDGDGVPDDVDSAPRTAITGGQKAANSCVNDYNCMLGISGNNFKLGLSDYNTDLPLLVDFQIRPDNPEHLQYMLHVLDWPDNDNRGQVTTGSGHTFGNSGREANGDLRLFPLLEVKIPSENFTYPTLPKLNTAPAQISATTPITAWLDTTLFTEYSIVVRQADAVTGDLFAYVPLNLVENPLTGDPVAFNARMVYQPDSTSWGADHTTRLVWMVEVINPSNLSQFIHVYEDEWLLSGLTVREDHGVEVAIVYEDPGFAQGQNDYNAATYVEQNLWALADGLNNSFLIGRTDNSGNRDITVQEIANRWDKNSNSSNGLTDGDPELWDIPKEALIVDTFAYTHQGQLGNIPTEINTVLNNTFTSIASQGVVTATAITIAREEQIRLAGLETSGLQTAASGKVSFLQTEKEHYVATQMAAYTYDNAWSPLAARDYWNNYFRPRVEPSLDQAHLALIEADADTETRLGFYAYAYSTFLAQFIGLNNLVQRDSIVIKSDHTLPDTEIAIGKYAFTPSTFSIKIGRFSRNVMRISNMVATILYADDWINFKATKDIRFAVNKLKIKSIADLRNYITKVDQGPVKDALTQYQRLSGWKKLVYDQKIMTNHFRSVAGNLKGGNGFNLLQDLGYVKDVKKVEIGQKGNRNIEVKVASTKLTAKGFGKMALIGAVVITGVVLMGNKLGRGEGTGIFISVFTFSAIFAATTIIQSTRQVIAASKGITNTKNILSLAAKTSNLLKSQITQMSKVTARIGVVLEVFVAVGLFIGLAVSSGLDVLSPEGLTAFAELVGTVLVSVLLFAISLIPGIGQILYAIILLIDSLLAIFCTADKDANPKSFVCQGLSGTLSKIVGALFYGFQTVVDPTKEDLVETGIPSFALVDPSKGFILGSGLSITLPVKTTLYKNKLNAAGMLVRPAFFNDKNAKQSTFDYTITSDPNYTGSPQLGADQYLWQALEKNSKLKKPDFEGSKIINGTAVLNPTGANALVEDAYFSLAYAIPGLECLSVVCFKYTEEQTFNTELSDIAFDILPPTLDEFLAMTRIDGGNGYSFVWGQSGSLNFPVFRDADGDGVASKAAGGTDPDDGRADNDGDRLSDLYELQSIYELDPTNDDTDGDGLTDYDEIYYNTDPTLADTDGDGLQDDDELFGWTIAYGDGQTTMVWSDPLVADADQDGYVDSVERAYGFNPNVPNRGDILTVETTFEEWVDVVAVAPCATLTLDSLTVQTAVRDSNEPLEFSEAEIAVLINGRRVWFSEGLTDGTTSNLNASFPFCDSQATVEVIEIDQGAWSNDAVGNPLTINADDPGATVILESAQQGSKVSLSYSMSAYNNDTVPVLLPSDGYVAKGQEVAVLSTVRNELQVRNALGLLSVETPANWLSPNITDQPFILPPNQSETIYGSTTVDNNINTTGSYDVTSAAGAYFDPNLYPTSSTPRVYTPTVHITFDDKDSANGSYFNIAPNSTAVVENVAERNPIRNSNGAFDQAAEFSRIFSGNQPVLGDALQISDTLGSLYLKNGSFTMASWVHRTTDLGSKGAIAGYMPGVDKKDAYPTLYVDGDEIGLFFGNGAIPCEVITPNLNPLVLNKWQHVAATFDASTGQVKIFLDGNRIHTASCNITPDKHYAQLWIGRASTFDKVYIDRIYFDKNGGSSPRQFRMELNPGTNTPWRENSVKDNKSFSVKETFVYSESGAGDTYNSVDVDRYKGNGDNYYGNVVRVTVTDSYLQDYWEKDVTLEEVRTGTYSIDWEGPNPFPCAGDGCGTLYINHLNESLHFYQASLDDFRLYTEAVSEDGVRDIFLSADTSLDLRLDEPPGSYNQYDFSGLRNDGYCEGTECPSAGVPGRDNRAVEFDGTNDTIVLGSVADLRLGRDQWTMAGWINPQGDGQILATAGNALELKLIGQKPTIVAGGTSIQAPNAIPLNQWTHVAFVRNGSTYEIFINGVSVQTGTASLSLGDVQVYLGGGLNGRIDQFTIRPATLIQADIQAFIDKAPRVYVPFDDAANSDSFYDVARLSSYDCADLNTCPTAAQDGQQYGSISFDGNDYLRMTGAQPATGSDWTTSFWVKVNGLKNGNQVLVSDNPGLNIVDIYVDSAGSIQFDICDTLTTSSNKIIPGTWNHIAVTYDHTNKTSRHYLNGSLDSSQTIVGDTCANSNSNALDLGNGGAGFEGEMDEVVLYNSVLSTDQLRDMFEYQVAWFDSENTASLIVDVDAPTAGFGTISALNVANPIIILTASDQNLVSSLHSGIDFVEYRVDGGNWQVAERSGQVWAFTLDTSLKGSGDYTVQARAIDNVGNVSTIRQSVIEVDTSGPTANLSAATAAGDNAVQFTGTATDNNGVSSVRVELFDLDGQSFTGAIGATLSDNSNNVTWSATYTTGLPLYGTYDAILTAVDSPGNVTTTTVSLTLDQTGPAAFLTSMDSTEGVLAGIGNDLPIISGHATDVPFLPNESLNLQFEETAAPFYDGSANRNHATCTNCPVVLANGQTGQAASFDGADDLLTIANANGLLDAQLDIEGTISFMAWVKPASLSGEQVIFGRGVDANNQVTLRLKDGQYQAGVIQSGTSYLASYNIPNGDLNQWVHLAGVYNGGEWLLYRNGEIVNRVDAAVGSIISGTNWVVGGAPFGGSHFNGEIDELLLYRNQVPLSTIVALSNPVNSSAVSAVEVGLLHLKDIANADAETTWYPATLSQPNSLFTGWSLQIPAGIEGPHRLSLRTTDADGRVTLKASVWSGEIDTQAPTAVLSFWDEQPNRGAFFACDVSDYNLTIEGISCPVRGRKALAIREYQDAQWFVDVFSPTQKLERAMTDGGRWIKTKKKTPQLTACDLYGNCTTVTPTPGTAPAQQNASSDGLNMVSAIADTYFVSANYALAVSNTPTTTVRIEEPAGESSFPDLSAAITISGFITAENFPATLDVKINGVSIYNQSWTTSTTGLEDWDTSWNPPAAGVYTVSATLTDGLNNTVSDTDNSLGITISPLELYVSDQAPVVTIDNDSTVISSVDFLPNGTVGITGQASDAVGIDSVEARFDSQPWQLMQLNGTDWSGGLPYPALTVADGDTFTLEVRATNLVSLTTTTSKVSTVDLVAPNPFTATLSYNDNGTVIVGRNETVSAVTNPTLTVNWDASSDPSGLDDYTVTWFNIERDGILTELFTETTSGTSSSYNGTEGQRLLVDVTAVDTAGNSQTSTAGPIYLDDSLTPAYIDMAEVGLSNQPYRNWTADSCNVLGVDSRRSLADGELFPLGTQNFYGTWNADGLRLAWQGADWNQDGDLFIYLDTAAGGADELYNPYPATADDTLILLPPNMGAEYAMWVQDENTATLLSWNGSAWVDSGQPFTFVHSNNLAQPQTDLLLPFSSLGNPTALSMVAVASEEDALRLWASQPNNNSLNSEQVVPGADSQPAHLFSLTQAYSFSNLGSGVCPSAGLSTLAISANATSSTAVIAYSQLSDGLFFAMPDTLSGLRSWNSARTALCATAPDAPLCERALIGNPTPAALDFDARATLAGSVGLDHEAVGPGQTVDIVVNIANLGTMNASNLKADIAVSGPLQLVGNSTVDIPTTAAGDTNSITIQVQAASNPADAWGSVDLVLYDGVNGSANEPLEWIFVDVEVDTGAPSLILLDPSQTAFNSAIGQRLFGTYVDQSPLQTITFESGQSCTNDSSIYGIWSCVTTGPTAAPTASLTGTDIFGATSSASTSPRIANVQDTEAPTLTIGLETELFFDDNFIEETETALSGIVSDNFSAAAVEVCRIVGNDELCEFTTVQTNQNSSNSYSYEDQTVGITIPACGSPLVRTFTVSESFAIDDLDVGLNLTHPFRNDVLVTLTSPQGTAVQIVAGGTSAADYSLLIDDTAANDLSTDYTDHDSNLLFDNVRRPANEMITVFGAEDPQGIWQLSICDQYSAADSGTYLASNLSFVTRDTAAAVNDEWFYDLPLPNNTELADQLLRIYAIDEVGNRSAPLELTYTIDTRGPQVTFDSFFSGQVTDSTGVDFMTIKYHGPNGETVEDEITLNGSAWSYPAGNSFLQEDLYAIYVEARDLAGNTSTINVYDYFAGNNPPTAVSDSYVAGEDNPLSINSLQGVLTNDSDLDGDRLTAVLVSNPAKGVLVLNGNGSFSYNPNNEFDYLDDGQSEMVSFTYRASDSRSQSTTAVVTIQINGINDAPEAFDDTATVTEDQAVTVDVLANDVDPEGQLLSFVAFETDALVVSSTVDMITGTLGLVTPMNNSMPPKLTFDPNDDFEALGEGDIANVEFIYEIADTAGLTDTALIYVLVTGVNDAPVTIADSYTVDEDMVLSIDSAAGLLMNDSDVDSDGFTAELVSPPAQGTLQLNADGSFTYDQNGVFDYLDEGETAEVTFVYQANDGLDLSVETTVTLTIEGINDPPQPAPDTATTDEDTAISIDVIANDFDPESQPLTAVVVDTSGLVVNTTVDLITGTVGIVSKTAGLNELTFDPNGEFETLTAGDQVELLFIYSALDTGGLSTTAPVSVTVIGVNDVPVFQTAPVVQAVQYSDEILATTLTVYDVDADVLTFSQTGLPGGITMLAADCGGATQRPLTCSVTLSGAMQAPAGVYTATISASDGLITTTQQTVFTVAVEDAVATLDPTNRVVIPVTAAGSNASEPFSIMATIEELEPDVATYTAAAGDINLAQASLTLVPVDGSSQITTVCTPELVDPVTGYNDVLNVSCNLADVPVNAYDIFLSINGEYYDGAEDQYILAVYDPSGGVETLAHAAALENCIVSDDKDTVLNEQAETDCSILSEGEAKIEKDSAIGGNITANDNIKLEPNTTVSGDAIAAGSVNSGQNVSVNGNIIESALVYQPVLPNIAVNASGSNIKIEKNKTRTLLPGSYGKLEVVENGTVNFTSGQYLFEEVKIGKNSTLNFDTSGGTILLSVEKTFELQEETIMNATTRAEDVMIEVKGGNVKLGKNGTYLGTFVAPAAHIDVEEKSILAGALYGDKVQLGKENTINGRPAVQFYFDLYIRPLVQNQPPMADAGPNQVVVDTDENGTESVALDGTGSVDSDGTIETYSWTENGVEIATGATPNVTLGVGVYEITLTVTDNSGNTASDVVQITVEAAAAGELIYVSSSSGGNVGGVAFADEDILVFDTVSGIWSMHFDGSDVGLNSSSSQDIDAFTILDDDSILFSIVGPSTIPGVGSVDDSDIVRFIPTSVGTTTSGTFELYFDGSDVGLTTNGEDIDAITLLDNGSLLLSTSGNFSVSGASGSDEDLLRFDIGTTGVNTSGTWSLYFDGSDVGLNNGGDEDVWGAWIDEAGDLHLSTRGTFSVSGLSGTGADVFNCSQPTIGSNTSCSGFSLLWDGSANDFGSERMDGLFIKR